MIVFNYFSLFQEVKTNPNNYDAWFDLLRLIEDDGNLDVIRETYERAIANVPPSRVIILTAQYLEQIIFFCFKCEAGF